MRSEDQHSADDHSHSWEGWRVTGGFLCFRAWVNLRSLRFGGANRTPEQNPTALAPTTALGSAGLGGPDLHPLTIILACAGGM